MSGIFGIALVAYIIKTVQEIRGGYVNWPKTVFVLCTVAVAFTMPALPNLDTAFQGLNTWHSFQYLAITFYILKIKQKYGSLDQSAPIVARFSKGKDSRGLYMFSTMLLVGSALLFTVVYIMTGIVRPGIDPNQHFDIAYYTSILAFLWIHYYHDHFLFTDFEVLDAAYAKDGA
jgi:Na+/H+ antiporter NhaD/arsenite permease-like protein